MSAVALGATTRYVPFPTPAPMSTMAHPMVEDGSTSDAGALLKDAVEVPARERRGLDRCRRALERGRRVRGRVVASDARGLLVDLRGALGHVPAGEAVERPTSGGAWQRPTGQWEGWVAAVGDDLVHLSARPPQDRVAEGMREGEVVEALPDRAIVRLRGDGRNAVVPCGELSWQPSLEPPRIAVGAQLAGRIVGLTVDHGPVLSPRSLLPTPWPAIALALASGGRVRARIEAVRGDRAQLRTEQAPRAVAIVAAGELPAGLGEGAEVEATVVRVDAAAATLVLADVAARATATRAPRRGRAAATRERPGPERAA